MHDFLKKKNKKSNYHSKKKPELNHPNISHKTNQNHIKYRGIRKETWKKVGALKRCVVESVVLGGEEVGKAEHVAVVGVSEKNKE